MLSFVMRRPGYLGEELLLDGLFFMVLAVRSDDRCRDLGLGCVLLDIIGDGG